MSYEFKQNYRFDAQRKLDADDWMIIPRAALDSAFTLDKTFAQGMVQLYFETVTQTSIVPVQVVQAAQTVRLRTLLGKTAIVFAEAECVVDARRAETSWRIAGGFLLAHGVNYGGRFYIGVEWQDDALKIYSAIRRYPPRLVNYFGVPVGIVVYRQTQGRIHSRIQEKFLQRVAAQLAR